MLTLIEILLGVAAIYSGGMYVAQFIGFIRHYAAYRDAPDVAAQLELHTFHLGLCFILAAGFLGLVIAAGG